MHKVIRPFLDKTDNRKPYKIGDSYNHKDDDRIAFLMEKGFLEQQSKQPTKDEFPKHVGGGYYELPNGERIKGKDAALEAMGGD